MSIIDQYNTMMRVDDQAHNTYLYPDSDNDSKS